jgi:hypothetical protein
LTHIAAPAALAAAGAALYLSDVGLRAPFSGLVLVVVALSLVAVGLLGRRKLAVLAAVISVEVPLLVGELLAHDSLDPGLIEAQKTSGCDPSCGVSLGAAALILLPVPIGLAGAGWGARALFERIRR